MTAYDSRIRDWSSDVCSSDLAGNHRLVDEGGALGDLTVHRDLVARADDDDIADGHRLERQLDERTIPEHPCGLGLQADEALDGLAGAALGARLQDRKSTRLNSSH